MQDFWLYVLGIVIFLVGLAISIGLHEIGHLVPAKLFGVRVSKYMIGFGPTIFSRTKGETEYGLKAIPLGGYIAMAGMYPPAKQSQLNNKWWRRWYGRMVQDAHEASNESMQGVETSRAFYALPIWKRIIIMLGGPFMNLVLAFVLLSIVLVGFGTAQATPQLSGVTACIDETNLPAECSSATTVAPAAAAGIKAGDTIVSINGNVVTDWSSGTQILRDSAGVPVTIVVNRNGTQHTYSVTPVEARRAKVNKDGTPQQDAAGNIIYEQAGFIGIAPTTKLVSQPITEVFPLMGQNIAGVAGMIVNLPQRIIEVGQAAFGTAERNINGPISVVGVGRVAGEIASADTVPSESKAATLIGLLASLNIALFVFNLIPLLPLDGGHIAGALWEGIRRQFAKLRHRPDPGPFDTATLMPLTLIVVALLMGMSALLIYADIFKPVSIFG